MSLSENIANYTDGVGHMFVHVVGSSPFAANWLSYTAGGSAFTPDSNVLYYVVSDTVNSDKYKNRVYHWNGTAYEPYIMLQGDSGIPANNAGYHNSVYRGKSLGSSYTAVQRSAISAGTFEDLYIGDYWTINSVTYRIAGFDYWYNTGDTPCTTHHAVIVPDSYLYLAKMNNSDITTGAYVGSVMYTTNLSQAKTTVNNAFGSANILTHRAFLASAVTTPIGDSTQEVESGVLDTGYNSTVELMTEEMLCGTIVYRNFYHNTRWVHNSSESNTQLPLFRFRPDLIFVKGQKCWLRSVASKGNFCSTGDTWPFGLTAASTSLGVRPAFGIK